MQNVVVFGFTMFAFLAPSLREEVSIAPEWLAHIFFFAPKTLRVFFVSKSRLVFREKEKDIHGCVLSLDQLQVLSHQMVSAMERVNAGRPTALVSLELY